MIKTHVDALTIILTVCIILAMAEYLRKKAEPFTTHPFVGRQGDGNATHLSYITPGSQAQTSTPPQVLAPSGSVSDVIEPTGNSQNPSPTFYFLNKTDGLVMNCRNDITIGNRRLGANECVVNASGGLDCNDDDTTKTTIFGRIKSNLDTSDQNIDENIANFNAVIQSAENAINESAINQ